MYHTKHKPGVCVHEVNLTPRQMFLVFQWKIQFLFHTTDLNQEMYSIHTNTRQHLTYTCLAAYCPFKHFTYKPSQLALKLFLFCSYRPHHIFYHLRDRSHQFVLLSINLEWSSVGWRVETPLKACPVVTSVVSPEKTCFIGCMTLCDIFGAAAKFFYLWILTVINDCVIAAGSSPLFTPVCDGV